ncbi:AhpA/YtjB family protein [Motilimonas cestriensis]|uniref:AhpA/YtjB family protein n=1 Tax=Motilimonas cestriensis TaxID=2742685 RepID=UPI003DA38F96
MTINAKLPRLFIWRMLQLIVAIGLIGYLAYLTTNLQVLADKNRIEQTQRFGYTLTNRAANDAARYLEAEDNEELSRLVDGLSNDPLVRDVTIYNAFGVVLHQSADALPLDLVLNLSPKTTSADAREIAQNRIPYIAELFKESTKIGYLRVTLEQGKILAVMNDYQQKANELLKTMLIVALLIGFLLTRSLSKKRHWWQQLMYKSKQQGKDLA